MIFINMKNYFTSGFEKYRHKHYYILAAPLGLTISMFCLIRHLDFNSTVIIVIFSININTAHNFDGFNVLECIKVILLPIVLCLPH